MADKRKSAFLLPALVLIPAAWAAAGDYGTVDAVAGDTVAVHTPVPHPEVTWVPEDYITEIGSFKRGDGAPVDTPEALVRAYLDGTLVCGTNACDHGSGEHHHHHDGGHCHGNCHGHGDGHSCGA